MSSTSRRIAAHAVLPWAACAAAALGVLAAPTASAQALSAQRIVIDKDTGRARMPEHEELASTAPAPAARAAARSGATGNESMKTLIANHPAVQKIGMTKPSTAFAGAQSRQIGLERLSFTVVHRDSDGTLSQQCVAGPMAADKALHGALKGDRHDH